MPRDTNGNMTRVMSYQPGTKARANDVNLNENDLASEIADSLSRSGKGKMQRPLELDEGGTGSTTKTGAKTTLGFVDRTGDTMDGALSSAVKDHGTKGAVTEDYAFADGNTHAVIVNGAHIINPTGLNEGGKMQINITYQSGSITVSGTTRWELGGGEKTTDFGALGVTLATGTVYRMFLEMAGGVRTGVFL